MKKPALYKLFFLGESATGKTCFINCLTGLPFERENLTSMGVDFVNKTIKVKETIDIILQLWDTAGQERYQSISKGMLKNADGVVLVYAINDRNSFERITNWIDSIDNTIPIILVGNKQDLEQSERQVTENEGKLVAEKSKFMFFETSVLSGYNIKQVEECAIDLMITKGQSREYGEKLDKDKVNDDKEKKKKKCC